MRPTSPLHVGLYRHLKLTTKDVNKGFYKGNRTGSMGRHTKYGGYVIEWNKVRTYAVPQNLKDFKVGSILVPPGRWLRTRHKINGECRNMSLTQILDLQLTPFVSRQIYAESGDYKGLAKGASDPHFYVEQWKRYNGVD
ncbi:hypothetical protein LLEC1_01223 [Akanthomyces lecanii]|uniref:Uncharacterized protein n=1 Tax=Cordyceps confragosa TaxID=2714763 RepID=A0A179I6Q0_CORDF|nr:hypothetical protein LLEC1_01223 [Akanthomyces lecanii]